jgi:CBS domain-containing protein
MFFVLELTHDLEALPALLVGSVAGLCVTVLMLPRSILTEKLARRGQHIAREYSVDVFEMMRVSDVMDPKPPLLSSRITVADLSREVTSGDGAIARHGIFLVDDNQRLAGVITRGDIIRILEEGGPANGPAIEAAATDLVVAYPDETLHQAIAKMLKRDIGRLPVVERDETGRVVGYLGRGVILAARERLQDEEELREKGPILSRASADY